MLEKEEISSPALEELKEALKELYNNKNKL